MVIDYLSQSHAVWYMDHAVHAAVHNQQRHAVHVLHPGQQVRILQLLKLIWTSALCNMEYIPKKNSSGRPWNWPLNTSGLFIKRLHINLKGQSYENVCEIIALNDRLDPN
jgi:hypothetical protein